MASPNPNRSSLDLQQILQRVFENDTDRLRTDAIATIEGGKFEVIISDIDDSIKIGDGSGHYVSVSNILTKTGLDVNIIGGIVSTSGLSAGLKNTTMVVTDVAQKIPAIPLTNRNGISVRVLGINTIFIGNSSVTYINGYPKYQREEVMLDIKDTAAVELWAVCEPGKSCEIRILEVS